MRAIIPVLFALTLGACASNVKGEDLLYEIDCDFVDTEVEWADAAKAGASATDLLAPFLGEHSADGAWNAGGSTEVTVTIAAGAGKPTFHELVGGKDQESCQSTFDVPVAVTVDTADGAFAEDLAGTWELGGPAFAEAPFSVRVEVEDLDGSFEPTDLGPDDEVVGFQFEVAIEEGALTGAASTHVQGDDGETAWDGIETSLTWPAA